MKKEKSLKEIIIYCVAVVLMVLSFNNNIFRIGTMSTFKTFQMDSENLVRGAILRDKYNLNKSKYGLYTIVKNNPEDNEFEVKEYKSQVGIQGTVFAFLQNKLHFSIRELHLLCSITLSIILVGICYLLKEKYGTLFAMIFYIVFILSPWIVYFAKNLYWVEFTWFLPLLLCLLLEKTRKIKIYIPLIFMSVLLKCLCGYEYLSTILLTAITFLMVDFIGKKGERKELFKMILMVGLASILAFVVAICIHAYLRGDGDIIHGARDIFTQDVMKRTMATSIDQVNISEIKEKDLKYIKDSIDVKYTYVITRYFNFNTDIIKGISGEYFINIYIISLIALIVGIIIEDKIDYMLLYFIFLLGTLSWFILAKSHSYIHTHMNYVLWYFGFIQMSFFAIINTSILIIKEIKKVWKKIKV